MRTRLGLLLLALLAWVGSGIASASPASAHAELVASAPSELQILDGPPDTISLVFDESVSLAFSSIRVLGPGRTPLTTGSLQHDGNSPTTLVVPLLGRVPAGDHVIAWRGVSVADGHPTTGRFSFRTLRDGVVTAAPRQAHVTPATSPGSGALAYGIARWISFLALSCLVGSMLLVAATRRDEPSRRRLCSLAAWAWGFLVASSVATFVLYGSYAGGRPLTAALDGPLLESTLGSRVGAALLVRVLLLSALLTAVSVAGPRLAAKSIRPGLLQAAVLMSGLALSGTWSAVSHSAVAAEPTAFAVLDAVHLVATASWLGGLVAIALVVLRDRGPDAAALTRLFSRAALVAVVVLVVTGSVAAWRRVGSAAALADNTYGRLLLTKGSLVVVLLLLAGLARFRLLRPAGLSGRGNALRTVVAVEAALGAVVLAVTSALVAAEPARAAHTQLLAARAAVPADPLPAGGLSGVVPFATDAGGRGTVELAVLSTRPGPTEMHVSVLTSDGEPQPLRRLSIALRRQGSAAPAIPVPLAELSPGHYVSTQARIPAAGQWQLGMALQLPSGATAIAIAGIPVR